MASTFFAPQLYIPNGVTDISFYSKAFGAEEVFCFRNDDDSIHVAEFSLDGMLFHVHEVSQPIFLDPAKQNGTTVTIGFFVEDVDAVMERAKAAGATVINPAQNYEYGYRQGEFKDPFGHYWLIEKKI